MKDFADEVSGYLGNDQIAEILTSELACGPQQTLGQTAHRMWKALAEKGVIPQEELPILDAWFSLAKEFGQ